MSRSGTKFDTRFFRLAAQEFMFASLCLWMFFFNLRLIQNPDLFGHLASGRYILIPPGAVPLTDPFSLLYHGSHWVDSYWLFEIILFGLYRLVGLFGLVSIKAAMIVVILGFQEKSLREQGVQWYWRVVAMIGLFLAAHPWGYGWAEQSALVTLFFVSLLLWRLERFRRKGWEKSLWAWPVLFMVWANMHPGFMIGWVLALCYMLGEKRDARDSRKRWVWLALCVIAAFATPYGRALFTMIHQGMSLSSLHVASWAIPPGEHMELFWISTAAFWLVVLSQILTHRKIAVSHLLAAVFLTGIGTRYVASVPYLMLFVWPYLAVSAAGWTRQPAVTRFVNRNEMYIYLAVIVILVGGQAAIHIEEGINKRVFPVDACDFIEREAVPAPFYNDYAFGGYWLWRFAGVRPVFIDGRYPDVQGYQQLLPAIEAAKAGPPAEWEAFLNHSGVQAALIAYPKSAVFPSVTEAYFPHSRWALVYWDDTALVFLERNALNKDIIKRNEFVRILPDAQDGYFLQQFRAADLAGRARITAELARNLQLHPDSRRTRQLIELCRLS